MPYLESDPDEGLYQPGAGYVTPTEVEVPPDPYPIEPALPNQETLSRQRALMELRHKKRVAQNTLSELKDVGETVRDWLGINNVPAENTPYEDTGMTAASRLWNAKPDFGDTWIGRTAATALTGLRDIVFAPVKTTLNSWALAAKGIAGDPVSFKDWYQATPVYNYGEATKDWTIGPFKGVPNSEDVFKLAEKLDSTTAGKVVSDVGTVIGQGAALGAGVLGATTALPMMGGVVGGSIANWWNTRPIRAELNEIETAINNLELENATADNSPESGSQPETPTTNTSGGEPPPSTQDGNTEKTTDTTSTVDNNKIFSQEEWDAMVNQLKADMGKDWDARYLTLLGEINKDPAKFGITAPLPTNAILEILYKLLSQDKPETKMSAPVGSGPSGGLYTRKTLMKEKIKKKKKSRARENHEREKKLALPGSVSQNTGAKGKGENGTK